MRISFPKLTVTATLSAGFLTLMVTAAAAQSKPQIVDPAVTLECAQWKVRYQKLIEQHEQAGGLSSAARDRATDLAYAGYARCVMGGKHGETEGAVANLKAIEDVLESGRSVARSDPLPSPSAK